MRRRRRRRLGVMRDLRRTSRRYSESRRGIGRFYLEELETNEKDLV